MLLEQFLIITFLNDILICWQDVYFKKQSVDRLEKNSEM